MSARKPDITNNGSLVSARRGLLSRAGDCWEHPTGDGQYDTHAFTKANGKPNRSSDKGKPYRTITWADFLRRAESPTPVPKNNAPWAMASTYSGHDARTAEVQRERGSYALLPGDIDEGNASLAELEAALHRVLGPCEWLVYSSASATPEKRKWRFWVPLAAPLTPADYKAVQEALLDLLQAEGIQPDAKAPDLNQIFFLPNVPNDRRDPRTGQPLFYRWKHKGCERLRLKPQHPLAIRMAERAAEAAAEARRKTEAAKAFEQRRAAQKAAQPRSGDFADDFASLVESFNAEHDLTGELLRHGYTPQPGSSTDFRSPYQTTDSYATHVYPEGYAISLSGSDAAAGLGHPTENGNRRIDAFEVCAHFDHRGSRGAAVAAWRETLESRHQTPAKPFHDPDPLPPVAEAREALAEAVWAFYTAVAEWHGRDTWAALADLAANKRAPLHLLTAGLGLGKTWTAEKAMVARLRHLRAKGDDTSAAVFLVPMHSLGEQIAGDLRQMAPELRVAVIRGAEAQDPQNPNETACKRLEDYRHRQRHLLDPCSGCPLKDSCLVEQGRNVVADIYLQAHGVLTARPAPCADKRSQRLDHVVIDESPMGALLVGVEGKRQLALAAWKAAKLPGDPSEAADLENYRARLLRAAEAVKDGPLTRTALLDEGLSADDAKVAAGLEWRRKVEDESSPELGQNLTVARAVAIFKAVAGLLAGEAETGGRLHVVTDPESGLAIRHRGLREIGEGWDVPMLALDATADESVTTALLQRPLARSDDIRAAEPMLTIRQDPSFSGAKSILVDSSTAKGKLACANNRRALETYIRREACKKNPVQKVSSNKALIELLNLPETVRTAHFNALRGLNDLKDVKRSIIIGRPLPDERTLAAMTGAIFRREVEGRINPKGTAWRRTVGGMDVAGKAAVHDDPDAQRLMHLIRDAEVMQDIGRQRAVNSAEPVEVILISDAVLPVPVELADIWRAEVKRADPIADMLEDGGVAFLSPAHAAKAYPARWKSLNAAKYALGGLTCEKTSLGTLYDHFSPVVIFYRLPRAKESSIAVLDARRHPVPEASLKRILGPLAAFEVLSEPKVDPDTAINETVKRLEYIAKMVGYKPTVTVREVENDVFIVGQLPADVKVAGLRARGWPVELVRLGST